VYEERQFGVGLYLLLGAIMLAMAGIAIAIGPHAFVRSFSTTSIVAGVALLAGIVATGSRTIRADEGGLSIRTALGLVNARLPWAQIGGAVPTGGFSPRFYLGRFGVRGPVAVSVTLVAGRSVILASRDPQALCDAIARFRAGAA
jgi:hypothetical protein